MRHKFEISRKIVFVQNIEVDASSEEAATEKITSMSEEGITDFLIVLPAGWDVSEDDTGYDGPLDQRGKNGKRTI